MQDALECVVEMHVGSVGREVGVAGGDGLGDETVFAHGCGQTRRVVAGEAANSHEVGAHIAERRGQILVGDGVIDRGIKAGDVRVVRVGLRVSGDVESRGKSAERGAITAEGCKAGCGFFECTTEFKQFADVAPIKFSDDGHSRRLLDHKSVGGETAECFTERSATDSEASGLLYFAEHRSRREVSGLNLVEESPVCAITSPHPHLLGRIHRWSRSNPVYTQARLEWAASEQWGSCVYSDPRDSRAGTVAG